MGITKEQVAAALGIQAAALTHGDFHQLPTMKAKHISGPQDQSQTARSSAHVLLQSVISKKLAYWAAHVLSNCRDILAPGLKNGCSLPGNYARSQIFKEETAREEIADTSGWCGASFSIEIVSEQFEGKKLLERHRMVNAALAEELKQIHALSITKALTPTQWGQQQRQANAAA